MNGTINVVFVELFPEYAESTCVFHNGLNLPNVSGWIIGIGLIRIKLC